MKKGYLAVLFFSSNPQNTQTHTLHPGPLVIIVVYGSRKIKWMEDMEDGFQEKGTQGLCVSDSSASHSAVSPFCSNVLLCDYSREYHGLLFSPLEKCPVRAL